MSKIQPGQTVSLPEAALQMRETLSKEKLHFLVLYAHNATGKTRLSREFSQSGITKDSEDIEVSRDTIYFNSFTEDLFKWDNKNLILEINSNSIFFGALDKDYTSFENSVKYFFGNYSNAYFEIVKRTPEPDELDREDRLESKSEWYIRFLEDPDLPESSNIKISRGEERIFIWCFFLAVIQRILDEDIDEIGTDYNWVKYIYIDDPISSLDDNNSVMAAIDVIYLFKNHFSEMSEKRNRRSRLKVVFSTHHGLFYNILNNDLGGARGVAHESYMIKRIDENSNITFENLKDVAFFEHLSALKQLKEAVEGENIHYYHFSMMRGVLEKISSFMHLPSWSYCIDDIEKRNLYARVLNLRSHGKHSLYEAGGVKTEEGQILREILESTLSKYQFFRNI